jgi:hypothetical protein
MGVSSGQVPRRGIPAPHRPIAVSPIRPFALSPIPLRLEHLLRATIIPGTAALGYRLLVMRFAPVPVVQRIERRFPKP